MGKYSSPPPPPPPDYAGATRAGILADIETLPVRRQIDAAARLGRAGSFVLDGETYNYDFTGIGDAELAAAQAEIERGQAFATARNLLDIQKEFGNEFLATSREQLKASDPIGFAIREKLGQAINDELALGGKLSQEAKDQMQQNVLAAQTARGNVRGIAPVVQEVLSQDALSQQRRQQRFANAAAFLSGTTPLSQFGQLRSAQQGAVPFVTSSIAGATLTDPAAGMAAAQFAQQTFGTQANIFSTQAQLAASRGNPWLQGLGMAAGMAGQLGSAAILRGGF